jgi:hypothetical protein
MNEREVDERDHIAKRLYEVLEAAKAEMSEDAEMNSVVLKGMIVLSEWEDFGNGTEWMHVVTAKGSDGNDSMTPWQAKGLLQEAIDKINKSS